MASGTVYRRETPSGASSWVAHGTWQEGGKRRQVKRSFRTKKEAQSSLTELLAAHQAGTFVAPSRMPIRGFVEPWLAGLENQGRKGTTLRGYRSALDSYVLPRLGDVALQELRASDLDAMYRSLLNSGGRTGKGLSLTSVHHVHAVLNKLLHDAERKGLVTRNVARLANAPSLTTARSKGPEMHVWTPPELSAFLRSIEGNRNEALFRLLAMTGMRRSEAVGLRWSDIDLRAGALTVAQAATVVDGEEVIDVPKTRRSRRTIDLDPDTAAMLERHQSEQRELLLRLGVTSPAGDRVFTNEIGDPMRPGSVGQAFGRLVASAGVPRIRLHDLRHTHASHLLMAGVNVKVVSERLGHASVSFTLDTYGHVMPGQQAIAAAAGRVVVDEVNMSADGREELRARVRVEEPSSDAAVVIRGAPDTLSLLQSHARRLNRLYVLDGADVFGVSVFVARDEIGPASERTILSSKLRNYATVYRSTVSTLREAGFVLLPTFIAPHFTVLRSSLDAADDLAAAFGNLVLNPDAEGREEER